MVLVMVCRVLLWAAIMIGVQAADASTCRIESAEPEAESHSLLQTRSTLPESTEQKLGAELLTTGGGLLGTAVDEAEFAPKPVPPAVVTLRLDAKYHNSLYVGVCGADNRGGCQGYGVKSFSRGKRMYKYPQTFKFAIEGDAAKIGGTIALRELSTHHKNCYLSVCGAVNNVTACQEESATFVTCVPLGSERHFMENRTILWEITKGSSWKKNGKLRLKSLYWNCYIGGCGKGPDCGGEAGHGVYCYNTEKDRVKKYPETTWLQWESPGPVVGRWIEIGSGQGGLGTHTYTVGTTNTQGSSVSASVASTVTHTLSSTIGFEGGALIAKGKAEFGYSLAIATTNTIQNSFSSSQAKSKTESHAWQCDARFSNVKHWVWQWVVDVPTWDGGNRVVAQVRTASMLCTGCPKNDPHCPGPIMPRCPFSYCSDENCQTCHKGWDKH